MTVDKICGINLFKLNKLKRCLFLYKLQNIILKREKLIFFIHKN